MSNLALAQHNSRHFSSSQAQQRTTGATESHEYFTQTSLWRLHCYFLVLYVRYIFFLMLRSGPEKRKKWLQPMKQKWILFVVRVTVSYANVQHTKHTSRTVQKMPVSSTSTTLCWCPSSLSSHTSVWYSAYSLQTSTHITSQLRNAI